MVGIQTGVSVAQRRSAWTVDGEKHSDSARFEGRPTSVLGAYLP